VLRFKMAREIYIERAEITKEYILGDILHTKNPSAFGDRKENLRFRNVGELVSYLKSNDAYPAVLRKRRNLKISISVLEIDGALEKGLRTVGFKNFRIKRVDSK